MTTKPERQALVRRLISTRTMTSQSALLAAVRKGGIRVDQSTLSRDLQELGIRKVDGRYTMEDPVPGDGAIDLSGAVLKWTTCGPHLTVLHTLTGQAQAVAVLVDGSGEPAVCGTVAGDDTVFLATTTRRRQTVLLRRLVQWFGEKHER